MRGERIKALREEKNLLQKELAEKIGISPSAIGMYETDQREAPDEIKIRLATFFNVSVDYLVGISNERNPKIINIGLTTDEYNKLSDEAKKQIKDFVKFVKEQNMKG